MEKKIIDIIANCAEVDPASIKKTDILADLGLDSLLLFNIVADIESCFDIEISDRKLMNIKTVEDAFNVVKELVDEK